MLAMFSAVKGAAKISPTYIIAHFFAVFIRTYDFGQRPKALLKKDPAQGFFSSTYMLRKWPLHNRPEISLL